MSFKNPEQFYAVNKLTVEAALRMASSALARAERLATLNLNTASALLKRGADGSQTLTAVKSPEELASLQAALSQPIVEQAVAYARSVNEIVAEGQQEISRLFETQLAELHKTFTAALEHAAKSAPAGSEPAFAAVKSALETASSVYENASHSVQQLTEANAAKAAEVTEAAVKVLAAGKAA